MKQPLVERLASLSPEQRALVELRLRKKAAQSEGPSIPVRDRRERLPLSLDQQRLWFVQQLDPPSAAYNIYTAVRFKGKLQIAELARSLNEIVRRHEIMRTCFPAPDGQPEQAIAPCLTVTIPLVDLCSLPPDVREREAARLAASNVKRPFDLAKLPLFRTVLLEVGDEEFVCPTVFHHIITDWVSFYAFDRELATLYDAFREGRASPLEPLPIQYADFAAWQQDWLTHEVLDDQVEYWRRRLQGAPPLLELPYDRPRPPVQTPSGFRQPLTLSPEHTEFIRTIARQHQLTPFIALLALFKILLFRLTGQPRVLVGSPIANRNRPELENLLGFFINHLVFCTDTGGDPLFTEFLLRVKETALGAYANQDVPFAKVVEAVRPDRDLSRTPLTQVVFLFLNPEQQGEIRLSGLRILPYTIDSESSKFDMTFSLWEGDSGYSGFIEYNPDLFDRTSILRMGEQFRALVAGLAADPQQRISSLPILHAAARQQLLVEWNDSAMECDAASIVQRIEEQSRLRPDAPAVSDDCRTLTFEQLNSAANRLARRLANLGIGPESTVAVLLPRSVGMVAAWLAVVKAGAAYVPLADDTPRVRWEGMLEDAKARVLVSNGALATGYEGPIVWMDDPGTDELCGANLDVTIDPQNLAYVIFTSGSTGRPKGVAIEHRSLSNLVSWHERAHRVKPGDRATQVASAGFDAAGWEIWPYLCAGASVAIIGGDQRLSPSTIVQYLDAAQATHCFLPSPLAEAVLEEDWRAEHLRVLLTGGDRLRKRAGRLAGKLWNHYGPTESTVAATAGPVEEFGDDLPDIGRPIGNTRAYVLDPHGNPVAIGVVGELCLGGDGVARGYVGRAAETAERFVPDAFSPEPGGRLYRTGDLARWGREGRLHFVGRADEQVKLRGYRIELGEIEAQLTALPGVRAAAAVVKGDGGRQRICAYVSGDGLRPERLRTALRERLPEYMEPSSIRLLDELPVTSNGKVDRAGLARLDDIPQISSGSVAPRNKAEETLAAIWRETLGLTTVGVLDNFFQVGGDSILSMRVVSRARAAGLLLTPRQIFEHQTIAGLAAACGGNSDVPADPEPVTGPAALAPIQRWFFEQDPVDAHHFNQALMLKMDLRLSAAMLRRAIHAIAAHHDALRLRFRETGAGWSAEIAGLGDVPLVWVDLRNVPAGVCRSVIEASAASLQRGFDLGKGPLFRVAFFDCGDPLASRLLVIAHHLVVDGVSWRILLEHLETALVQASRGDPVRLPAKTCSYRQWAEQTSAHAPWKKGAARADNTVASCAAIEVSLDVAQTSLLIEQAAPAFRTQIVDLLLTACSDALGDCGLANCAVDFEGHGRDLAGGDLDVSRTVGWFTVIHTLPPASKDSAPLERLKQVKTHRRAISDTHFAGPDGGSEVLFNYLGRLDLAVHADSPLQPAPESVGPVRSPSARRNYLFEVDAGIVAGRLEARWVYSRNIHSDREAQDLAAAFERALLRLLAGRTPGDSFVPQDFPLAEVNQAQLDALVARYGAFEDAYGLSPVQEGMLIHALSTGRPGAFHERLTCTLSGPLDEELFRKSWQRVVDRHAALRTCFYWSEFDKPVQIVMPAGRVKLSLSIREAPSRMEEIPFDLTEAPLLRLDLIDTGDQTREFAWTCHHLILDGWSLTLILREVMEIYAAGPEYQEVSRAPAHRYADFVGWLKRQDSRRAEDFWRRTLRGFRSPTLIGGDTMCSDGGHRDAESMDLPESLSEALRTLGSDSQLTLNTLFQGAWALLLSRASGRDDVVFGVTAAGRPADLPGAESIVGTFANTQPLRVRIPPDAKLIEWLDGLQVQQADAREFEYTPLAQQYSEVPLGVPLFETLLVFENYPIGPGAPQRAGGIQVAGATMPVRTRFPLTLVVLPGEILRLCLSHDPRSFTSETCAAILQDLRDLLVRFTLRRDWSLDALIDHETRWRPAAGLIHADPAAGLDDRPRTPVEEVIAAVWTDVLGARPLAMNQSLFEMGGHSLLATRLASRLREAFHISLPLKYVFEAPTISGLAKRIESELANRTCAALPRVEPLAVRTGAVPLSYAQEPIWLVHKMLPGTAFYNFFAMVRLEGELHVSALARSFAAIVGRHEALRIRFAEMDGRTVQRIQPQVDFAMPLIDISALQDSHRTDEAAALAARESRRPFRLAGEPLLRAHCLRVRADEHLLCVTMHHIATDGWSSGILARELMQLYEACTSGHEPLLAPLTLQQPDFAAWERERAAQGGFDTHIRHWLDQLDDGVRALELPTDRPRSQESFWVAREEYAVSGQLCGRLRELSQREGVSLFMTLLTALQKVLTAVSGQSDYWMGTLVARRNQAALEGPIGLFVNTVLLRCRADPADSQSEALRRTRSAVLEAFEYQDLPFELLMDAIDGKPGIDRVRVCPVLFIMQNAPLDQLKLSGLKVTPLETRSTGKPEVYPTSFDMIVNIAENPDSLIVSVSYKTELFDKERIDRIADDWGLALDAMADKPCLLPPEEE